MVYLLIRSRGLVTRRLGSDWWILGVRFREAEREARWARHSKIWYIPTGLVFCHQYAMILEYDLKASGNCRD